VVGLPPSLRLRPDRSRRRGRLAQSSTARKTWTFSSTSRTRRNVDGRRARQHFKPSMTTSGISSSGYSRRQPLVATKSSSRNWGRCSTICWSRWACWIVRATCPPPSTRMSTYGGARKAVTTSWLQGRWRVKCVGLGRVGRAGQRELTSNRSPGFPISGCRADPRHSSTCLNLSCAVRRDRRGCSRACSPAASWFVRRLH
jgi:hypothetical protein